LADLGHVIGCGGCQHLLTQGPIVLHDAQKALQLIQ
jgi:hypothetical protein